CRHHGTEGTTRFAHAFTPSLLSLSGRSQCLLRRRCRVLHCPSGTLYAEVRKRQERSTCLYPRRHLRLLLQCRPFAMTDRPLPLSGIRVLELAQIVAGPFCGTLMAEFGAEVIKTELPGKGDDLRRLGPTEDGCNYWYAVDNRGKKVMTLDLRTAKGQDL